jgi:hypothetical protein
MTQEMSRTENIDSILNFTVSPARPTFGLSGAGPLAPGT